MSGSSDMGRTFRKWLVYGVGVVVLVVLLYNTQSPCGVNPNRVIMVPQERYMLDENQKQIPYDRNTPLIFIGGVPRSGTTLMRAMLDAHPDVRCGEETRVVPRILQMRSHWMKSQKESMRLEEAGLSKEVLNSAIASFILEVIAKHGEAANHLCNKDPFTLKSAVYLSELFPRAKFLFMVRDGRATVHSIIARKVTITGFELSNFRQCLTKWNTAVQTMHSQCRELGPDTCLHVYYEQLVLHPEVWMRKILTFLQIPWNNSVLHHEQHINKPGGVSLSKVERSSDQVIKPVNLEALSKWVGNVPQDVVKNAANIAPMLSVLGYDPYANPPNYGKPDSFVADNTNKIQQEPNEWSNKAEEVLKMSKKERKTHKDKIEEVEYHTDDQHDE